MSRFGGSVTITDVARSAGVSTATVSRVLNGITTVDPALAKKVHDAIALTGYVPNGAGRALRRQRSDTWAAIVPDVQNTFFTSVVAAVEDVAAERGFSVVLCNTDERLERERRYITTAIAHRMSGVVIAVASARYSDLTPLERADIPIVVIDRAVQHTRGDSVLVDNLAAGQQVATHLVRQGYRRLACIAGPSDVPTTEDRLQGFRQALQDAGISLSDSMVRRADLRADGAEVAMRSLLAGPDRPDAVFATNGPSTVGAYSGIQAFGLRMPDEIALVGVDDQEWTRMVSPAITVIRQPVSEIGRFAAQLLSSRAANSSTPGDTAPNQDIVLAPVLLPRGSSVAR